MSIYLPDMEMPERCNNCRMCEGDTSDGFCHAAEKWFDDEYFQWYMYQEDDADMSKPINCPLVELPPHGRLIDESDVLPHLRAECWGAVKGAKTIIEAEGENGVD